MVPTLQWQKSIRTTIVVINRSLNAHQLSVLPVREWTKLVSGCLHMDPNGTVLMTLWSIKEMGHSSITHLHVLLAV